MQDMEDRTLWNLDRHAGRAGWRRFLLFAFAAATTAGGIHLLATALGPQVPYGLAIALLVVFALGFGWITLSFWAGADRLRAEGLRPASAVAAPARSPGDGDVPALHGRTAILVPVYNEDPTEVFARHGDDLALAGGDRPVGLVRIVRAERHDEGRDRGRGGGGHRGAAPATGHRRAAALAPPHEATSAARPATSWSGSTLTAPASTT